MKSCQDEGKKIGWMLMSSPFYDTAVVWRSFRKNNQARNITSLSGCDMNCLEFSMKYCACETADIEARKSSECFEGMKEHLKITPFKV